MTRFAEFPLGDGGTVVVEVDSRADPTLGPRPTTRGLGAGDMIDRADVTFVEALSRVQAAASDLLTSLRGVAEPPDEVEMEFGVQMSADIGAFIAKASGEANFQVTLRWKPRPRQPAA